jgi:hypothetical protein
MDGIGSEKPCQSFWFFLISFKDRMDGWMDGLKVESPSFDYFLVFYFTKVQ